MQLSRRGTRSLLRVGTALDAGVPLRAAAGDRALRVQLAAHADAGRSRGSRSSGSSKASHNPGARDALWTSVKAGLGATAIALVLGTLASRARSSRYRFFGRETISFLVILPIALPGIVTGMALNATFTQVLARHRPGAVHRHRRPRHVLHRRRLQQRRRAAAAHVALVRGGLAPTSAPTRGRRSVTSRFPQLRSALVAGALLAFALSFDEVIVTTFTAGPARRRCRSGSSTTSRARTSCRSSTSSRVLVIVLSIDPGLPRAAAHGRPAGRLGGVRAGRRRRRGALVSSVEISTAVSGAGPRLPAPGIRSRATSMLPDAVHRQARPGIHCGAAELPTHDTSPAWR